MHQVFERHAGSGAVRRAESRPATSHDLSLLGLASLAAVLMALAACSGGGGGDDDDGSGTGTPQASPSANPESLNCDAEYACYEEISACYGTVESYADLTRCTTEGMLCLNDAGSCTAQYLDCSTSPTCVTDPACLDQCLVDYDVCFDGCGWDYGCFQACADENLVCQNGCAGSGIDCFKTCSEAYDTCTAPCF